MTQSKRQTLLLLALMLLALPAAANWSKSPAGTAADCPGMGPGLACFYNDGAINDSPMIYLSTCVNGATVFVNSDLSSTSSGAEGYWRMCAGDTKSDNECNPVYSDAGSVTLNGDPATGRAAIYGVMGRGFYWDATANTPAASYRIVVVCH